MKNPFVPFSIAMITPFSQEGDLLLDSIQPLVDYYRKEDVPALLISGSTGEQHSMTVEERKALFAEVKKHTKDDLTLNCGVAAVRTKDAVDLAIAASEANLDGIMLGFPPYLRISQKEAFQFVEAICAVTNLPIMLYNNPPRTGFHLETNTLVELVHTFPQILALKEAGDPTSVVHTKALLGEDFIVLSGSDLTIIENHLNKYDGITSILGNIYPKEMKYILELLQNNKQEDAKIALEKIISSIHTILELGALRSIKYLLERKNIPAGICREPLSILSKEEKEQLDNLSF